MRADQKVPGYEPVYEQGGLCADGKQNVLPLCYGTTELLGKARFEELTFPESMAALGSYAVVEEEAFREGRGAGKRRRWIFFQNRNRKNFLSRQLRIPC